VPLVKLLHAVTFFYFLALGLTTPILPLYLNELGIGPAWIGWAIALMPLAGILLRPVTGWVSDAWSRKWPMVIGLLIGAVAALLYLGGLPLVLLGRVLQGISMALFAPSSLAVTSDLVPDAKLGSVMATRNLLVGIGVMIGSGLAGLLVESFGFTGLFWAVLLVQLAFVPLLLLIPETLETPSHRSWWGGYAAALRPLPIRAASLSNLGLAAAVAVIQAYYPLILSEAGYSALLIGLFFSAYGLVSVLFRLPAGRLIERFSAERVALWGFLVATSGGLLLWLGPLPPLAFVAGALLGGGSGFYLPANLVAVSRAAPKALRGSAFSLYTVTWDVGGLIGPVAAGFTVAGLGLAGTLPLAAGLMVAVIIGYLRLLGVGLLRVQKASS
jgi:MFS family permease